MITNLSRNVTHIKGDQTEWTVPVFVIDAEKCPKIDVWTTSDRLNPFVDPDKNNIAEGLPIPEGVWADPKEDGHMVLVDPKLRKCWDFSKAKKLAGGGWIASRIDTWDLDGLGFRMPFEGKYWWKYGARGSGMPLLAGLIRPEEVEAGEIKHALVFGCPINRRSAFPGGKDELCSPPASRTDGKGIGQEYIPEGALLQLDPALNLDLLKLSPATKIVARAMQKYGMYNCDNSKAFKIYFQNLGPGKGQEP